jgi:hypothetical protein
MYLWQRYITSGTDSTISRELVEIGPESCPYNSVKRIPDYLSFGIDIGQERSKMVSGNENRST